MDYIVGQYYKFRSQSKINEFNKYVGIPKDFLSMEPKKLTRVDSHPGAFNYKTFSVLYFENIGVVPFGFNPDDGFLERISLFIQEEMEI